MKNVMKEENDRTTVSLSRKNFLILKKIGYALECDSMNRNY